MAKTSSKKPARRKPRPVRNFAGSALAAVKIVRESDVVAKFQSLPSYVQPTALAACASMISNAIDRFQREVANLDHAPSIPDQRAALDRLLRISRDFLSEISDVRRNETGALVHLQFLDFASRDRIEGYAEAFSAVQRLELSIASALACLPKPRPGRRHSLALDRFILTLMRAWRVYGPEDEDGAPPNFSMWDAGDQFVGNFLDFTECCLSLAGYVDHQSGKPLTRGAMRARIQVLRRRAERSLRGQTELPPR